MNAAGPLQRRLRRHPARQRLQRLPLRAGRRWCAAEPYLPASPMARYPVAPALAMFAIGVSGGPRLSPVWGARTLPARDSRRTYHAVPTDLTVEEALRMKKSASAGLAVVLLASAGVRPSRGDLHHRRRAGGDPAAALLRGRSRRSERGHHPVLGQQRLRHRRAGPRHGLVRPVGPGPRLQRLPDRLRRAVVNLRDSWSNGILPRTRVATARTRPTPISPQGASRRTSTSRAAPASCPCRRLCRRRSSPTCRTR